MESSSVPTQMKAIDQYFPAVFASMLHKMIPTFESVDGILKFII